MFVRNCGSQRQPVLLRRNGNRFSTEVSKFKTISTVKSFTVAGRKFSQKFNCCYDDSKRLIGTDRARRNADNISYTFSCACGTANFVLQFRLYSNVGTMIGEKEYFVYRVFVKECNLEDALLHFKEMSVDQSTNVNQKVSYNGEQQLQKRRCEGSNVSGGNRKTSTCSYCHHHLMNLLQVPLITNISSESEGGKKMQFISDGKELSVGNCCNGILSTESPMCVIDSPESIGMFVDFAAAAGKLPKKSREKKGKVNENAADIISEIANIVGHSTTVTVINVPDQQEVEGWNFGTLAKYFHEKKRKQVINQVSYEFSGTKLATCVRSPQFVREVDWIINSWPANFQNSKDTEGVTNRQTRSTKKSVFFPCMQYYCVTSSGGAYMDFHIDVGGTSFWYHLVCGSKQFVFVKPTDENLTQYEDWVGRDSRYDTFFADLVKDKSTVWRILLKEKETLIVPSGWIHAVYTEKDSIAFGGNFLNGYSAEMQIKINNMEMRCAVEEKFRCPFFNIVNLFAANAYLKKLEMWSTSAKVENVHADEELKQLTSVLKYISSEYEICLKPKMEMILPGKGKENDSTACVEKYKSVYEEPPTFDDAVKYVLSEQKCLTMENLLLKFVTRLTELIIHVTEKRKKCCAENYVQETATLT